MKTAPFLVPKEHVDLYGADCDIIEAEWNPKKGDVCVDVGFGPGMWTLYALAYGAYVHAFDPRHFCHELLEKCLVANNLNKCTRYLCGLYDRNGTLSFNESQGKYEPGHSEFPVITLDALNLPKLDYVNLDVEAAEVAVLCGATNTLIRCKPKVIVEVHYRMGVTINEVKDTLRVCGYTKFRTVDDFVIAEGENHVR